MIFTHADELEAAPFATVAVERTGARQRGEQGRGRIVAEREPVWFLRAAVVANGIRKTAHLPDNRHGSVAEAVHLVEPAGLELGRHQEDVRSPLDEMREALVESDPRPDAFRNARREGRQQILIPRFTGAEHDEGRVELRELTGERRDQIEALLV